MFKLHTGPTNYFHLTLIIIAGIAAAALIYISYLFTMIAIDESAIGVGFIVEQRATLALTSDATEYAKGDTIQALVSLITKNRKTPGADIVLSYDPAFLQLVQIDGAKPSVTKGQVRVNPELYLNTTGSGFDTFPFMSVDYSKSIISFAALKLPLKEFQGNGDVASLRFKAIAQGATAIKVVFENGSTTDSNVAFNGRDILTAVTDLSLTIK